MAWWAKCLLYKHEDPSWILSIDVKRLALWRESVTPAEIGKDGQVLGALPV